MARLIIKMTHKKEKANFMNEHLSKISEMLKKCRGIEWGKSATGSTSNCSIYLFDGYAQLNLLITPGFFCYLSGRGEKKNVYFY